MKYKINDKVQGLSGYITKIIDISDEQYLLLWEEDDKISKIPVALVDMFFSIVQSKN